MSEKSFVHLHNHSEFSLIDGSSLIESMASICNESNMPAIALTDHGNMYGAVDFYNACKSKNMYAMHGNQKNSDKTNGFFSHFRFSAPPSPHINRIRPGFAPKVAPK